VKEVRASAPLAKLFEALLDIFNHQDLLRQERIREDQFTNLSHHGDVYTAAAKYLTRAAADHMHQEEVAFPNYIVGYYPILPPGIDLSSDYSTSVRSTYVPRDFSRDITSMMTLTYTSQVISNTFHIEILMACT
jgi:hypothetical protein